MDIALIIFMVVHAGGTVWACFKLISKINDLKEELLKQASSIVHYRHEFILKIADLHSESSKIKHMISSIKDTTESPKEIRRNNWDSVREAFKAPSKVDFNDRT